MPGGIRRRLVRHSLAALAALAVLLVIGVVGYRRLEEASYVDALHMTVVSIRTVGYGEIPHPFSPATRLFTIGMIAAGVSIAAYALGGRRSTYCLATGRLISPSEDGGTCWRACGITSSCAATAAWARASSTN
ncbi:MAG TPA: potassium channel family protein [Thermoleophilia bacterium]|nr:potassium channel family protein [Thermoleophilia bacterium]